MELTEQMQNENGMHTINVFLLVQGEKLPGW